MILRGLITDSVSRALRLDSSTYALKTIDYPHAEIHGGNSFFISHIIADLGAATTPTDMMTLTFTAPASGPKVHFTFSVNGTAGWLAKFFEGGTGGGASPTGSLTALNRDRNSTTTSLIYDVAGTPAVGKMSYDATEVTGATTLWQETLGGSGGPFAGSSGTGMREEFILDAGIQYQISLYGTDNAPGVIYCSWYEHTDKY